MTSEQDIKINVGDVSADCSSDSTYGQAQDLADLGYLYVTMPCSCMFPYRIVLVRSMVSIFSCMCPFLDTCHLWLTSKLYITLVYMLAQLYQRGGSSSVS